MYKKEPEEIVAIDVIPQTFKGNRIKGEQIPCFIVFKITEILPKKNPGYFKNCLFLKMGYFLEVNGDK